METVPALSNTRYTSQFHIVTFETTIQVPYTDILQIPKKRTVPTVSSVHFW